MLSIVVPCYNEQESIPLFYQAVEKLRPEMGQELEYVFVNDGSNDETLSELRALAGKDSSVHYLSFSRAFGKEAALYAGLQSATGDLVTVMDVDLQDPPELLPKMIHMIQTQDIDCVGTRRADRAGEPLSLIHI